MPKSKDKNTKLSKTEYSKRLVTAVLVVAFIMLQENYILAFLGMDPMENLAMTIVTSIIGVSIGYFVKAYLGKKASEATRLEEKKMDAPNNQNGVKNEESEEGFG